MPHVGVKGFRAGDGQEDGADHGKAAPGRADHQFDAVYRVQRKQDAGVLGDVDDAEQAQHGEPDQHERAEEPADGSGACDAEWRTAQSAARVKSARHRAERAASRR